MFTIRPVGYYVRLGKRNNFLVIIFQKIKCSVREVKL